MVKIIWRASRPKTEAAIKEYKELLAEDMVAPTNMEVYVANADGSNVKQVTNFGQANWAPSFSRIVSVSFLQAIRNTSEDFLQSLCNQ
jgi:Tol biopolymer transport system component